ncbi:MAG: oligoendopeptidase F [Patescibacteria group bacterium]|jgi:oligoendopeptidase F
MPKIKKRSEVKEFDKWDLSLMYANEKAWDDSFSNVKKQIGKIEKMSDKFSTKEDIFSCLNFYFSLRQNVHKLHSYARKRFDEDVSNSKSNIRLNSANDLNDLFQEKTVFIYTSLSGKTDDFLNVILKDKNFKNYIFFIKKIIREKKHLLSDAEEKILAKLGGVGDYSYNIFGKINNSDFKFPDVKKNGKKIELNHSSFIALLQDEDRGLRKDAMQKMFQPYKEFRETLSQNLFQHIKNNVTFSNIRKYDSAIGSFSFGDDLKPLVYENLFKEVDKNLHLLQRYYKLRKKILFYDKLYWHDLNVSLVKNVNKKISYEKAVDLVLESLKFLGDDYIKASNIALKKERWVDKYPNTGKRSGAYSSFDYKIPAYILMNFNETLDSASTLAHELGHSMHTYFSYSNNHYSNYSYPIFLAEIASTFNKQALSDYLLKNGDKKTKLYIIDQELKKIRQTFFKQSMFAEFEKKIYDYVQNGGMLTADFLEKEYYAINKKYYGEGVELDELVASEWSRIPHFFYNFYVYKYATGLAISNYFFESVKNGGQKELDNYLNLLKSGGSDFPANLLKKSGLDIYNPGYLKVLMKKFESLLDEFEKEVKTIN